MKNWIKTLASNKKTIGTVAICGAVLCALIASFFFFSKKQTDRKNDQTGTTEEKTGEKAESSTKGTDSAEKNEEKKEESIEARSWQDYEPFVEEVKAWLEDDSQTVSAKELGVNLNYGEMKAKKGESGDIPCYYQIDLDSDGTNELLFGYRNRVTGSYGILDIYTKKDGLVSRVAGVDRRLELSELHNDMFYLCQNGYIEHFVQNFYAYQDGYIPGGYHAYYTFRDGNLELAEAVISEFVGEQDTKWYYSTTDVASENATEITYDEAKELWGRDGYEQKELLLTPFTERYSAPEEGEDAPDPANCEDKEDLTFSDLEGKEFWFYSGAGGWNTSLHIRADGTFGGCYQDFDAGHIYESNFKGTFSGLTKTGPYEYTMQCASLKMEQEPGTTETRGENVVDYTEPYGFEDAGEFKIYLPGKKWSELSGSFLSWAHGEVSSGILECYSIYNVGGEEAFVEMDLAETD